VYNSAGTWLAALDNTSGNPLVLDKLWNIGFGNGGNGGFANTLYFTAGLNGESDGLFGSLSSVPEPGTLTLLGTGFVSLIGYAGVGGNAQSKPFGPGTPTDIKVRIPASCLLGNSRQAGLARSGLFFVLCVSTFARSSEVDTLRANSSRSFWIGRS
jgi:hypothetical protein